MAAGEGKRMKPISDLIPKIMIPILDKPFLEYVLTEIKSVGISDIVLVVSPKNRDYIKKYFSDGSEFGLKIDYAIQEERKGTAHAISKARKFLDTEYFLVHYGDSLTETNMPSELLKNFKKESGLDAYLTMREEENTSRYGVVKFEGHDIVEIVEKPPKGNEPSNMVMIGLFILKTESFFNSIKDVEFVKGKEEFPAHYILEKGGKVRGWVFHGKRIDLGKPEDIIHTSRLVMRKYHPQKKNHLGGGVENKNCMMKNCFVSRGAVIGKDAVIENSYISEGCEIGENCEVKDSVIFSDLKDGEVVSNEVRI